jgi:hypothetical protein
MNYKESPSRELNALFKELLRIKAFKFVEENGLTERQTITQFICSYETEELLIQALEEMLQGKQFRILLAMDEKELDEWREDFVTRTVLK